ncbi:LacI family DNA-binding transcriptional regulator [Actinotalea sp. Marseille-Q4924]|uniref:LacI family DNA-binding transcriptional regulator n=1 Tax=Actinotalea sp. Marseille-Q4924 TaxID=2866571 RepID=UPI001CE45156|nr:LacI family DNA-binding transcriptional regulator [Actinotalea sp. Marseille-Q4924]
MAARLQDVAERAGVSVRTVSNVVNDFPHVRPAVRERVQQAIADLGYTPNMTARFLRGGRTGMIALAVPDLSVPYFAELAGYMMRAAHQHGLTLLIEETDGDREREVLFATGPRSSTIDGLILSPLSAEAEDLSDPRRAVPVVLLGERTYDEPIDHIAIDNVRAARDATTHLIHLGRRRVAAIGARPGHDSRMADLRLDGYHQALAGAGVARDERLVVATPWFTRQDGYDAVVQLVRADARPDALFCFNDLLALGAIRALADHDLRCPEDVAVVGIDGIEEGAFSVPTLTTIAPDMAGIASRAVDLLVARIGGREVEPAVDDVAGFTLVVRGSTGGGGRSAR